MSVATTTSKIQYTLTTGAQALAVPFYFLDNAHIKAVTVATETLPSITLVLGTDYTLIGAGNPAGGTLTTIATIGNGLAAGSKIVIKRNVPITQPTSYSPNDAFPAKVHEAALDRGIMLAQQIDEQADRAIRLPEDESGNVVLPPASERANKVTGFDSTGANLAMKTLVGADGILETESIGEDALQGAFRTRAQASVALMKAQSYTNAKTGDRVELLGYYARGDGGGGRFVVDKADTTTADNGVTVFVASDGTRLKSIYTNECNVLRAGAKADGVTDNTAIFATCLAVYAGKSIYIPKGNYRITSALTLPGRTTIRGDGPESTVIYYRTSATTSNSLFTASDVDNICLKDMTLYCDHGSGGQATTAIRLTGDSGPVSDVILDRLNIDSFQETGIHLEDTYYVTISRSRFIRISNKVANGGTGIGLGIAMRTVNSVNGIYVLSGTRFSYNDCVFSSNGYEQHSFTFRDSFFEQNGNAASPATSDILVFNSVNALVFEGNYCEGNKTGSGANDAFLRLINCKGVSVRGNLLFSDFGGTKWSKWLIRVSDATRGISVENNYFANPITGFVSCDGNGSSVKLHRNTFLIDVEQLDTYDSVMAMCTAAYMDFDRPLITTFAPGSLANLAANALNITMIGARVDRSDTVVASVINGGADVNVTACILNNDLVRVTVLNVKGTTYDPGTLSLSIRVFKQGL